MNFRGTIFAALLSYASCSAPSSDVTAPVRRGAIELPPPGECDVVVGDVRLSSQQAVVALGARGCKTINGDVLIDGATDLSSLATLTTIQGDLFIRETELSSLAGLDALGLVGGEIVVQENENLLDLTLPGLTSAGRLVVTRNLALRAVHADSIAALGGDLELRNNPSVTQVSFDALANLSGRLAIVTTAVTDVDGFGALQTAGSVVLSNNEFLSSLAGFAVLRAVTDDFVIRQNGRLTSLGGFPALVTVGGRVAVAANPLLQDTNLKAITSSDEFLLHKNAVLGSTTQLNAEYQAASVSVIGNPQLNDLTNVPIGPASHVRLGDNDALSALTSLGPVTLDTLRVWGNAGLRATTVPIVSANYVGFWSNGSTSLTFAGLTGSVEFEIYENSALTSITAPVLSQCDFQVWDNPNLTTVTLASLVTASDIEIIDCPNAAVLSMPAVTQVTDDINLVNTGLEDLTGLGPILSVADDFNLIDNAALLSVDGLQSIGTVGGLLQVTGNTVLTSVAELSSLTSVAQSFTISDNPSLPDCQATDLAAQVNVGGSTTTSNNAGPAGCP